MSTAPPFTPPFTTPAWPPFVHWRDWPIPPPPLAYVRADDYLAVSVLTSSATTGLALRYRLLQASGEVTDGAESLDGAETNTLRTTIYKLTEGFLLSATVSNIGGGLSDNVCGVVLALQKGGQASTAPHTILAQGYVSNIVGVTWPVGLPRGPATSGSSLAAAYTDGLADIPPTSPNAKDDEFDGATLDTSLWTWDNQGTATATTSHSLLLLTGAAASDTYLRCILQPVSGTAWTYAAKIKGWPVGANAISFVGLIMKETASSSYTTYGLEQSAGVLNSFRHEIGHWSDNHTVSGYLTNTDVFFDQGANYFRIRLASGVLYYEYSADGWNWREFNHENVNAFFTAGPNSIGLFTCSYSFQALLTCDWFRKTA